MLSRLIVLQPHSSAMRICRSHACMQMCRRNCEPGSVAILPFDLRCAGSTYFHMLACPMQLCTSRIQAQKGLTSARSEVPVTSHHVCLPRLFLPLLFCGHDRQGWLSPDGASPRGKSKVKYTRSGIYHALAIHLSGTNAPRETLPQRIVREGCSSQDANAGPRDRSNLPYRTWHPWAAGSPPGANHPQRLQMRITRTH